MAAVFISFIHEEVEWAESVQAFISLILGTEAEPFMSSDKFQVYAGEKWLDRIMDELKGAKVVLLMLSKASVKRPWVNFEAGAAWGRDIVTIPVCYAGLRKEDLPKPYSNLQAVDLNATEDHGYLARSVAHYLELPEPPLRGMYGLHAALSGSPEAERRAQGAKLAYESLSKALEGLNKRFY